MVVLRTNPLKTDPRFSNVLDQPPLETDPLLTDPSRVDPLYTGPPRVGPLETNSFIKEWENKPRVDFYNEK